MPKVEEALYNRHKEQKRQELERQVEEYYLSLSDEEREEDRQWSDIAAESAHHLQNHQNQSHSCRVAKR